MELSQREREVATAVATGQTNVQIGRDLSIADRTVQSHLRSIFGKWGVSSRTGVAVLAIREGLLSLEEAAERVRHV